MSLKSHAFATLKPKAETAAPGSMYSSHVTLQAKAGMNLSIVGQQGVNTFTINFPPNSLSKEDAKTVAGILNGVKADCMFQEGHKK